MNCLNLTLFFIRPGRKGLEFILKITNVILSCKTVSLRLSETIYFVNQEVLAFARMTISCNKQEIPARWLESYCQHQCIVMAGSTRNLHQLARRCHGGLNPQPPSISKTLSWRAQPATSIN
jgi:hypothetical protein